MCVCVIRILEIEFTFVGGGLYILVYHVSVHYTTYHAFLENFRLLIGARISI